MSMQKPKMKETKMNVYPINLSDLDTLDEPRYELRCQEPDCEKKSFKNLISLAFLARVRCDHCFCSILIKDQYSTAKLEKIAAAEGRRGCIIPDKSRDR